MKAVVQDVYGSADVLRIDDVPRPQPRAGEVLLRVEAAGVGPEVWHLMAGLPYVVRLGTGLRAPRQQVPGRDVAGRVEALGPGVDRFQPGDEVMGTCAGALAEFARAKQDKLTLKPAQLTAEQAAAVPVSGATALQALRDQGRVRPGQRVLVVGASGGVGTFAVQLAAAFGASVTGVCSTAKADYVHSLGAEDVIDYTSGDITDRGPVFDLVVDVGGARPLPVLRRALTDAGTLVIVGGESGGPWFGGMDRQLRAMLTSPFTRQRLRVFVAREHHSDLETLNRHIEAGTVQVYVDRTFALENAAEAVRYLHGGHPQGKVVVTVGR